MLCLDLRGTVTQRETGLGLAGLVVAATTAAGRTAKPLGFARTDDHGAFRLAVAAPRAARGAALRLEVLTPDRSRTLFATKEPLSVRAESVELVIPGQRLGALAKTPSLALVDAGGAPQKQIEIGDQLAVLGTSLAPLRPHDLALIGERGHELFVTTVITDRIGGTGVVVVWPQAGLDDPRSGSTLNLRQAMKRWAGRRLRLELRRDGKRVLALAVPFARRATRPLLFAADAEGNVQNGFEAGRRDAILAAHNLPFRGAARVFLVPRQHEWRPGNTFRPIVLADGRPAFADVEVPRSGSVLARLARGRDLTPGAYDFIMRPVRYGYEDEDDFTLRATDVFTGAGTGLVVREEFMASKFVRGGCANMQPISGRTLSGAPYFQYADTFQVGADVWAALDPLALDPGLVGKMVALYVVPHKTAAQWTLDPGLAHLAVLGGNMNVPKFKTQSGCINYNKVKIWPAASQVGEYDIVADFGNNTPDAMAFLPDASFDQPLDIIDGYVVAGFRVVPDPATDTQFAHAGTFSYDDGPITVTDDWSAVTVQRKAIVYFPADAAGATQASQISAAQANYPLVVVVHGNSSAATSYLGYNYLLEHLAKNGLIAASIHMNQDMAATGRARMLFAHIDLLKGKFGATCANNIGIMGHSRGGEAVVAAARINHQESLGHGINAVISLAPTDWILGQSFPAPFSKPYLVVYGSMDGDVAGVQDTGFELYDRTSGQPKSMVFVYGSTHGRYNTVWGDTDITASWSKLTAADLPKLISADAHQKIAKGYMTAFFRQHLKGEAQWSGIFRGEWRPAAVEQADGGAVKLYVQYEDTVHREVDNFTAPHPAGAWQTSTIGGAVNDDSTLPVVPVQNQLLSLDSHSPHDTGGLQVRWDTLTDRVRFEIPAGQRNVSGFAAVSFRVAQKTGSASNPAGQLQDLYLTLRDTNGQNRAVRVSKFAEIPHPHERGQASRTKTALATVRIPLHVYTIAVAGQTPVDLQAVDQLSFEFNVKTTGEVHIDSVEFTN